MDEHANEMEVIGGYSYSFADVKIMSARLNPPPHPLCPPVSLFAKVVLYLTKNRLLATSCEDDAVPEGRRLVVATQSKWVPINNKASLLAFILEILKIRY